MWMLVLTIPIVWTCVLTFYLFKHYHILFGVIRWTLWVYLTLLSLLVSEVLREGLIVNGDGTLTRNMSFWWFLWFACIAISARVPVLLVPGGLVPLVLLRHAPFRMLMEFGLARMGWLGLVYDPVSWLIARASLEVLKSFWLGRWSFEALSYLNPAPQGRPLPFGNYTWNR